MYATVSTCTLASPSNFGKHNNQSFVKKLGPRANQNCLSLHALSLTQPFVQNLTQKYSIYIFSYLHPFCDIVSFLIILFDFACLFKVLFPLDRWFTCVWHVLN